MAGPPGGGGQRSSRWFFFWVRMSSATGTKPGAMITSVKMSAIWAASASVTIPLVAITPPNAEAGSHSWASRWAWARSSATAIPHGLACFMIATQGSAKS